MTEEVMTMQIPAGALLLRYQQAWQALGFSRSRFFTEVRLGRIPVLQTPAGPRVKVSDLEAYIAMLECEAAEARQAS